MNEHLPCDTIKLDEIIATRHYGIATPQRSDLSEPINDIILELTESGFLDQLKQKWFPESIECGQPPKNDVKRTSVEFSNFKDMAAIFYILIIGMILVVIVALIEFLWRAKSDSNRLKLPMSQIFRRNLCISLTGRKQSNHDRIIEEQQLNVH